MKGLYFDGEKLSYRTDLPLPELRVGECLIKTLYAGICDTDLQIIRGYMDYRGVPGHEFVGIVEEEPAEYIGKRVVGEINCPCGKCQTCKSGLGNHCPHRTVLGILGRDGCFAEYFALPENNLHIVSDSVNDKLAVFAEPIAAAYNILELVHIKPTDKVLVLGDGKLGLLIAAVLGSSGLNLDIAGHHPERTPLLKQVGYDKKIQTMDEITGQYDVAIEATGSAEGVECLLGQLKPRGKLILKTTIAGNYNINLAPIVINEIEVIGSRCGPFIPALRAISNGTVNPLPLIEKVTSPDEVCSLFETGISGLKHIIEF